MISEQNVANSFIAISKKAIMKKLIDVHKLEKPLPGIDEQINFMRTTWKKLGNNQKVIHTRKDFYTIEAVLNTLCVAKMIIK